MIDIIGRQVLQVLRDELQRAVQPVATKHGISITVGRGTYGGKNGTLKLEIATLGADGKAVTREAEDFTNYAKLYDLDPRDLGRDFGYEGGKRYTIIGLALKSRKRPVLGQRQDGKVFKFTVQQIRRALGRPSTSNDDTGHMTDFDNRAEAKFS